jgi:Ser/Thr protein kinase RdoA (MazF antagonist)
MPDYVEMAPELLGIFERKPMQQNGPLDVIAALPPQYRAADVRQVVSDQYGLHGDFVSLVSERDQNFRLTTADNRRYVVKIANAAEKSVTTEFQIRALLHMQKNNCRVRVPRITRTLDGAVATSIQGNVSSNVVRVVSYLAGRPLDRTQADCRLAAELGSCLAEIDIALQDFEHPGDSQSLLWDMQQASELHRLLTHVSDDDLRSSLQTCLDDFENNAAPMLPTLRNQIIHNDLNPENVLVTDGDPVAIAGVIDFGDMIRAPLIIDVAIAAAYLREDADPMALLGAFVSGYDASTRLEGAEIDLLYYLVRMRLATTIIILNWRLAARSEDDAYTIKSLQGGRSTEQFLARINAIPAAEFTRRIRQQCGR